jgi:hypothetical protein
VIALIATILSILEGVASDATRALMFHALGQFWFVMGSTAAKIAICLFFIRLVGNAKLWMYLLGGQAVGLGLMMFALAVTTTAQCTPITKLWDQSVNGTCMAAMVPININIVQGGMIRARCSTAGSVANGYSLLNILVAFPLAIPRHHRSGSRDASADEMAVLLPVQLDTNVGIRAADTKYHSRLTKTCRAGIFATVRTYEASQAVRYNYTFDAWFSSILQVLEQNIGIVAANVLTMGPLFSRRQRDAIRAESRATMRSRSSTNKTPSLLIIQGNRDGSFDDDERPIISDRDRRGRQGMGSRMGNHSRASNRDDAASIRSANGGNGGGQMTWPRGIIKTVEVEVFEEDIADVGAGNLPARGESRMSMLSFDQDWANMLRGGGLSPGPGSRSASRQG